MARLAMSESESLARRMLRPRNLLTCTIAALALGTGAMSAHALDGTSGEFADTEGLVQALCQNLRQEIRASTDLTFGGDLIFACDADGEQCHLVSGATGIDQGQALGFCSDSIPDAVQPHREGALEGGTPDDTKVGVTIRGTTFGTDIGYALAPDVTGDIFCQTLENTATGGKKGTVSPGRKVCVDIFKGTCPGGVCPTGDGSIVVRQDSCNTVRQVLDAAFTSDAFQNLAYWGFIDVDKTGQQKSVVLSVCPGFAWGFVPLSEPILDAATIRYQGAMAVLQTPGCFKKADGSWCCYCSSPTRQCFNSALRKYLCDDDTTCDGL
jgi:hypothetical protein